MLNGAAFGRICTFCLQGQDSSMEERVFNILASKLGHTLKCCQSITDFHLHSENTSFISVEITIVWDQLLRLTKLLQPAAKSSRHVYKAFLKDGKPMATVEHITRIITITK